MKIMNVFLYFSVFLMSKWPTHLTVVFERHFEGIFEGGFF